MPIASIDPLSLPLPLPLPPSLPPSGSYSNAVFMMLYQLWLCLQLPPVQVGLVQDMSS